MTLTSATTQTQHRQSIIDRYTQRTAQSKQQAATNRAVMAA